MLPNNGLNQSIFSTMSYGQPTQAYGCPGYGPPQPSYPYGGTYPQQGYPQQYCTQQPQT